MTSQQEHGPTFSSYSARIVTQLAHRAIGRARGAGGGISPHCHEQGYEHRRDLGVLLEHSAASCGMQYGDETTSRHGSL